MCTVGSLEEETIVFLYYVKTCFGEDFRVDDTSSWRVEYAAVERLLKLVVWSIYKVRKYSLELLQTHSEVILVETWCGHEEVEELHGRLNVFHRGGAGYTVAVIADERRYDQLFAGKHLGQSVGGE